MDSKDKGELANLVQYPGWYYEPLTDLSILPSSYVDSAAKLIDAERHWLDADVIGIDTEFERIRTYFPRPALIQLCDGKHVYLIDPLAIDDLRPILKLLTNADITKVLHAFGEDMSVFKRLGLETPPANVFDTQLAAAFVGHGYSLGYRALVSTLFSVDLPKEHTRSDWIRRPLSAEQLQYAALDVCYLPDACRRIRTDLHNNGRLAWAEEDFKRSASNAFFEPDPADLYLRIGGADKLDRRGLGVLRALCAWREHEAKTRNTPRAWVLSNDDLLAIASRRPTRHDDLPGIRLTSGGELKRSHKALLAIVGKVMALPAELLPKPLDRLDPRTVNATIKHLQGRVKERAARLDLPPEMLASKRTLEQLARHIQQLGGTGPTEDLVGWRQGIIGQELVDELMSRNQ